MREGTEAEDAWKCQDEEEGRRETRGAPTPATRAVRARAQQAGVCSGDAPRSPPPGMLSRTFPRGRPPARPPALLAAPPLADVLSPSLLSSSRGLHSSSHSLNASSVFHLFIFSAHSPLDHNLISRALSIAFISVLPGSRKPGPW